MKESPPAWRCEVRWTDRQGRECCQEAAVVILDARTLKLIVDEQLAPLQECVVVLLDGEGAAQLRIVATASHVRSVQGERHVSCLSDVPLSEKELTLVARAGLFDRRTQERRPVELELPAWHELNANSGPIPVRVIDLSIGGCCVKSPRAVGVGHRLMIYGWDEQRPVGAVQLRVQWQQATIDAFLLGCAFTHGSAYPTLSALIQQDRCGAYLRPPAGGGVLSRLRGLGQSGLSMIRNRLGLRA